jgi:hypothetical protein
LNIISGKCPNVQESGGSNFERTASKRLNGGAGVSRYLDTASDNRIQKWEYATDTGLGDYLQTYQGQKGGGFIDHALSVWGRNGWELVSITPNHDRLVGFFKRPMQ